MSFRAAIVSLTSALALVACSANVSTTSATTTAPATPCACSGIAVAEGTVDAACGASVCVGHAGYRCSADGQSADADPTACPHNDSRGTGGQTGTFTATLPFDGKPRTYAVYVPKAYTGEIGVPLVFHFHGWRPAPAGVKEEISYVWKSVAEQENVIVVAPEGAPCPELNPNGDPFLCFDETRDDAWIKSLVQTVQGQYNVDLDRVFLSGHSGGSFFVQGYGLMHATQFRAAVTFSGGCISDSDKYGNSCSVYAAAAKKVTRKIPYYVVHNPDDQVVPQEYSLAMKEVWSSAGFKTDSYFKAYNGGSNGHSIDAKLVPGAWAWLKEADLDFTAAK